jgi:competence protein ComEC
VTYTPTFAIKPSPGVQETMAALKQKGVPTRVVTAGDVLEAGDLTLEVLHPPKLGPEGNENARSLVLLARHAGHTILLTGDLEGPGLDRVLSFQPVHVDVLKS